MLTSNNNHIHSADRPLTPAPQDSQAQSIEKNRSLNDSEYASRKSTLLSFPTTIAVQVNGPCNQNCVFCARPPTYRHFDLDRFRERHEKHLMPALQHAQQIHLYGFGELLLLPRAREVIAYFSQFSHAEKRIYTNGTALSPKMIDCLIDSNSHYTLRVSLHGGTQHFHRLMTSSEFGFAVVDRNLKYLNEAKSRFNGRLNVQFLYMLTTANSDHLHDFFPYVQKYGADSVHITYPVITKHRHKEISCFFDQGRTNECLDKIRTDSTRLKMRVTLPSRFDPVGTSVLQRIQGAVRERMRGFRWRMNLHGRIVDYPRPRICDRPWTRCIVNDDGYVSPCESIESSGVSIAEHSFLDVWNGQYYSRLRREMPEGKATCSRWCQRVNPASVNDLRSHVCARGKSDTEMQELLACPAARDQKVDLCG